MLHELNANANRVDPDQTNHGNNIVRPMTSSQQQPFRAMLKDMKTNTTVYVLMTAIYFV